MIFCRLGILSLGTQSVPTPSLWHVFKHSYTLNFYLFTSNVSINITRFRYTAIDVLHILNTLISQQLLHSCFYPLVNWRALINKCIYRDLRSEIFTSPSPSIFPKREKLNKKTRSKQSPIHKTKYNDHYCRWQSIHFFACNFSLLAMPQ